MMSFGYIWISGGTITDLPLITKSKAWVAFKGKNVDCDGSQDIHKYTVRIEGRTWCVQTGDTCDNCLISDG
jgi:hypothetical protein